MQTSYLHRWWVSLVALDSVTQFSVSNFRDLVKARAMKFREDEWCTCCTAWKFALLSTRDDHGDDDRSLVCLVATVFQIPRGAQRKVRRKEPTVTCLGTALRRLWRSNLCRHKPQVTFWKVFRRPFSFKTSGSNSKFFIVSSYFNDRTSYWRELLNILPQITAHICFRSLFQITTFTQT